MKESTKSDLKEKERTGDVHSVDRPTSKNKDTEATVAA